jgi:hypothetical protein
MKKVVNPYVGQLVQIPAYEFAPMRTGWKYTVDIEGKRNRKVCSYGCSNLKQKIREDKERRKDIEKDYIYK